MQQQKPSIGRIVHFSPGTEEVFPAVITKVWSEVCVNLEVFGLGAPNKWPTSVLYGAETETQPRWFWPPRA